MDPAAVIAPALAAGALAYIVAGAAFKPERERERSIAAAAEREAAKSRKSPFAKLGEAMERVVPLKVGKARATRARLDRAGIAMQASAWRAAQVAFSAAGAVAGLAIAGMTNAALSAPLALCGAAAGWLGSDFWLDATGRARSAEIDKLLPSALELMIVSVSAGLPLERGLRDVARDPSFGAVAQEFGRCEAEVSRLGIPRDKAVANMRERCGSPVMGYFCAAVIDATQKGTSIAPVLESQAELARKARFDFLRKKAATLDSKMAAPLMLILMATLLVLVVPAVMMAVADLGALGGAL